MVISSISSQSSLTSTTPPSFHLRWRDFDLKICTLQGSTSRTIENKQLKGSSLSCPIDTEAGQWKNRMIFIETVLSDIISKCPKEEPLVVVSLGYDRLLVEYILGKTLIENGFSNISFLLVDPVYVFSDKENLLAVKSVLKDFREKITSIYHKVHGNSLANEQIRYLSRAQNISKCFTPNANVVVIESLPPDAEVIKDMKKHKVREKKPIDLMMSGYIVPPNNANTVALIPPAYINQLRQSGATLKDRLPLAIFKTKNQSYCYIDWGCKIKTNGDYHLSLSAEDYIFLLGVPSDQLIKSPTGEVVKAGEFFSKMGLLLEQMLQKEIAVIKGDDAHKQLSQENISSLLVKVQEVATQYLPKLECFFLADYFLDRSEAMTFIASNAGHHYRKLFQLAADVDTTYKIDVSEI